MVVYVEPLLSPDVRDEIEYLLLQSEESIKYFISLGIARDELEDIMDDIAHQGANVLRLRKKQKAEMQTKMPLPLDTIAWTQYCESFDEYFFNLLDDELSSKVVNKLLYAKANLGSFLNNLDYLGTFTRLYALWLTERGDESSNLYHFLDDAYSKIACKQIGPDETSHN